MKLVLTVLARDEADVIEAQVAWADPELLPA